MTYTALVFYCRNCGGLFYAAMNNTKNLAHEADDIRRYILEGNRLAVINSDDIDDDTEWCHCDENPELEDSHE